jgi:putative spermidine/putrescine transport system permease protein
MARRGWGRRLLTAYLVLFFVYLESPLVMVVLTSFNDGLTVTFPPTGFSTRWYGVLWDHVREVPGVKPGLLASLGTSLWLAGLVVAGAVGAGVLAAVGLHRFRFPGRDVLRQAFLLPILFPQIVTGVGLVVWFSAIRGVPTWVRLLLGHLILTVPYVVVTTTASLETLDERVEEAAMNLGANRLQTFWHVTLPGIRAGVVSGAVFAWLISFSNFTVTFFLYSGEQRPLPMWLYEMIQYVVDPSLAALSTLLVAATLGVVLVLSRLFALGRLIGLRR